MTYFPVQSPYNLFSDIDGEPLESGYIYIGEANQNPITNPITVSWDSNGLYPAAQPIRTIGGYPDRNGSPSKLFFDLTSFSDYSILINDKRGRQVFYSNAYILEFVSSNGATVDFISDLRAIQPALNDLYVRGHTTVGDGGQGVFEPLIGAAPGTYVDDDGIIIVPTGGDGSAAWLRSFDKRYVSVAWFGMNEADDMGPIIQAAIDYAATLKSGPGSSGVGSYSIPTVMLPKGKFQIQTTIDIPYYLSLSGTQTMLSDSSRSVNIIDIAGYNNKIEGIIFDGGQYQIRVIGPNVDTMQLIVDWCEFKNPGIVSIFHDIDENHGPGSSNPRNGFSMHQIVSNFKAYSSPLIHSKCDQTTILNGWSTFRPYLSGAGFSGDVFWAKVDNAIATVENVLGVSYHDGTATDLSFWFKVGNSTDSIEARISVDNCRFGEGGSSIVYSDYASNISIFNSAVYGRAGNQYAWMEIYNQIPSITVKNCIGWIDSLGILIDDTTIPDLESEIDQHASNIYIDFKSNDDNSRAENFVHTDRATYKTNGLTQPNVTSYIYKFIYNNTKNNIIMSERFSPNLFTSGVVNSASGTFVNITVINNIAGANNTDTGYTLSTRTATADGAQYGRWILSWGLDEAPTPGIYCFSLYLLTDNDVKIDLRYNNRYINRVNVAANIDFERIYGVFYHDGTDHSLGFQMTQIPNGTSFCVGLFQVNTGITPSTYKFPGNSVIGHMPDIYYDTAAPVAGTYKDGDIVYNTAPVAGGTIGWVCTTPGSPGTWKTFGTIAV